MKTAIFISGQVFGNLKLRNAIITAECIETKGQFNTYTLEFETKTAAIKALSAGFKTFCLDMPEEKNKVGGFRYIRGSSLAWDASIAKII